MLQLQAVESLLTVQEQHAKRPEKAETECGHAQKFLTEGAKAQTPAARAATPVEADTPADSTAGDQARTVPDQVTTNASGECGALQVCDLHAQRKARQAKYKARRSEKRAVIAAASAKKNTDCNTVEDRSKASKQPKKKRTKRRKV